MRSPGLTPSAISAFATRLVLMSNSAKVVSAALEFIGQRVAAVLARSRTMSARFVGCCEADMSLP